jgi:ubiquinone/menaquinone biosynthesis C-methylase UbiE
MSTHQNLFANIGYQNFKQFAADDTLTLHEKIGFPNAYRENKEEVILKDILSKLTHLNKTHKTIVDIGAGCGQLTLDLIEHCQTHHHRLIMIDSEEMLSNLPDVECVVKMPGCFPFEMMDQLDVLRGSIDAVLCYSVLHYIFQEGNVFAFLDQALSLLALGGQMLIGDIPNHSMRMRLFSSPTGISFHQDFTQTNSLPQVQHHEIMFNTIDDSVLMSLVTRTRLQGCNAYLVPQHPTLPMANRREDLLIHRP